MKHHSDNSCYYHHQSDVVYPMMNLQEFIHEQTQGFSDSADSGSDRGSGQSEYGGSTGCYPDSKPTTTHSHGSSNSNHSSGNHLPTEFSSSDIALATSPDAHYHFDPSNARFNDDDLKPQPIISKSRKTLVPETMKDNRYWARRAKNNVAAKRSREARRLKENQIILRAAFLERENQVLRSTIEQLTKENEMLRLQESTSSSPSLPRVIQHGSESRMIISHS